MRNPIDLRDARERRRLGRFVAVGLTSTALDFILLTLLKAAGFDTLLANTLAFGLATIYNFIASRMWTYAGGPSKPVALQFGQFALVSLLGLLLNDLVVVALDLPLRALLAQAAWSWLPAKILATGLVALWSYATNRIWIFAEHGSARAPAG